MFPNLLLIAGETTIKLTLIASAWLVSDPVRNLKAIALAAAITQSGQMISSYHDQEAK